jgi:hypothetical protein
MAPVPAFPDLDRRWVTRVPADPIRALTPTTTRWTRAWPLARRGPRVLDRAQRGLPGHRRARCPPREVVCAASDDHRDRARPPAARSPRRTGRGAVREGRLPACGSAGTSAVHGSCSRIGSSRFGSARPPDVGGTTDPRVVRDPSVARAALCPGPYSSRVVPPVPVRAGPIRIREIGVGAIAVAVATRSLPPSRAARQGARSAREQQRRHGRAVT